MHAPAVAKALRECGHDGKDFRRLLVHAHQAGLQEPQLLFKSTVHIESEVEKPARGDNRKPFKPSYQHFLVGTTGLEPVTSAV